MWFYQDLMRDIRENIEQGTFQEFKSEFIKQYTKGGGNDNTK